MKTSLEQDGKAGGRKKAMPMAWVLPLVLASACLSPAEERVRADQAVGQAQDGSTTVRVRDGLAAVTQFDGSRITLWSSAPSYELSLELSGSADLELSLHNVVAGSELVQLAGAPLLIEEQARTLPTRLRHRVHAMAGGSYDLAVRAPGGDGEAPFRIALLSDVQEAIDDVQDIFELLNREPEVDFLLGAGDLTQQGTRRQLTRFKAELESLNVPYYTTLGNHELGTDPPPFHAMFGRGSYSFQHKGAVFTLLDSASATLDPTVYEWLEGWTERAKDALHVVAMHIPPVDPTGVRNGSFASRAEANKLLGRLKAADVDLTLYGHVHSYYRFENGGIAARISGGGGAIPERFDNIGRHFLVIDLDPRFQGFKSHIVRVD